MITKNDIYIGIWKETCVIMLTERQLFCYSVYSHKHVKAYAWKRNRETDHRFFGAERRTGASHCRGFYAQHCSRGSQQRHKPQPGARPPPPWVRPVLFPEDAHALPERSWGSSADPARALEGLDGRSQPTCNHWKPAPAPKKSLTSTLGNKEQDSPPTGPSHSDPPSESSGAEST